MAWHRVNFTITITVHLVGQFIKCLNYKYTETCNTTMLYIHLEEGEGGGGNLLMHNSSDMNMAEQNDLDLGFSYSYFK